MIKESTTQPSSFSRSVLRARHVCLSAAVPIVLFSGGLALADPTTPPANVAPPISTISTGEGQYFCIYHDRVYSVGAEICVGPKWALHCDAGDKPTTAAQWKETKIGEEVCTSAIAPVPQ